MMTTRIKTWHRPVLGLPAWVWGAFAAAAAAYTALGALLYLTFRQPAFDLAIYDQTLWLLADGGDFNTVAGIHVWGAHFSPALWLLSPLSVVPGGAIPELVFQALWVAAGVVPAYLLGADRGRGGLFAARYVAHPGVSSALGFGFHPYTLAAPLLMALVYLVVARRSVWAISGTALSLLPLREDMALWVILVLAVAVISGRMSWRPAAVIGTGAAFYSAVVLFLVLPGFSPTGSYLFETSFGGGELGGFDSGLIAASQIGRLAVLLLPLGIPAVRANWRGLAVILVPMVGLVLRSGVQEGLLKPVFHYEVLFVPLLLAVLAVGEPVGLSWRRTLAGVVAATLVFGVLRPWPMFGEEARLRVDSTAAAGYADLAAMTRPLLEDTDAIAVPGLMVGHFSERERVFIWPYPFDRQYREPYPMACPHPHIVVAPDSSEHAGWEAARSSYRSVGAVGTVNVYVLRDAALATGECGPAGV